jgi:hypothetical protein
VVAAYHSSQLKGCRPSEVKGLRFDPRHWQGQALDFFHPLLKKAIIGLSPKAFSFYFSFSRTPCLPRCGLPGTPPLLFLLSLAHVSLKLAERIWSSLPDERRAPKGLGLDGIRGASYAPNVPAKQKRVTFSFSSLL